MITTPPKYCPFYCEENIWHLAQAPEFAGVETLVALVSNPGHTCLFWDQRVCQAKDEPVLWDYHVVLLARRPEWVVYDLDTQLPFPINADTYLAHTFRGEGVIPPAYEPRFVLFEGADYVNTFASDRSHMLDKDGQWLAPPPKWPPVHADQGEGFLDLLTGHFDSDAPLSLAALRDRLRLSEG